MIKFNELQVGDYVIAGYEEDRKEGEVTELNNDDKQACVDTGDQSFWYSSDQLHPIPLDDYQLSRLNFKKEVQENGNVKYMKGAFRSLIPREGDFSKMEIWYRDEQRHITHPLHLHEFQNHYYEMTKVHLDNRVFD